MPAQPPAQPMRPAINTSSITPVTAMRQIWPRDGCLLDEQGPDLLKDFTDILAAGIPALKEKKREEGVTLMCLRAMQFLDSN